jgi:predicted ATP-grasp superfamily ATP-dependent carboligase
LSADDFPMQKINNRNDFHVKIFVCEFVTGGGLYREPLPSSLAQEGGLMLGALLDDLAQVSGVSLMTSRDARLPELESSAEVIRIDSSKDIWSVWEACLQQADALWPIAPESGDVLACMSEMAIRHNKRLLGSSPQAVRHAASKFRTNSTLATAGIPVVPTFRTHVDMPHDGGPWVAKPDDGIGCEDSRLFRETAAMRSWLAEEDRLQSHVIQPYIAGVPASISMVCKEGKACLLSCNRQLVDMENNRFRYRGSVLNGMRERWDEFELIAQAVAKALPGLAGYAGIDVMVNGPEILVLEVNPRLTTSYAGLRRASGCNPARLVMDMHYNGGFTAPSVIERNIVEILLNE